MSHVDKLKDLVYSQKRTVSIRDVCYSLNVHVSEARRIFDEFLAELKEKDSSKLVVTYIVSGSGLDSTEDYKVHKLTYAKAEELDEIKKGFETISSCKVNSISLRNEDEENVSCNGDDVKEHFLDRDDFLKKQKLTYIVNDNIQLRPDRLERLNLVSGVTVNGSNGDVKAEVKTEKKEKEKEKENKTETKKETKSSKRTTNRRGNGNKKQSKLSGFGSKIPKSEKTNSSGDSGFSMESTPDPFSEEEEEEKSPVSVKEEEMEVDPSPVSPPSSSEEKILSEDEKPRIKEDDSEDEAIFMEEVKGKSKKEKSKKRKRVRIYDSDEDEDEEAMALRILAGDDGDNSNHSSVARSSIESNKSEEPEEVKPVKKLRKKSKPMETKTISEEFVDDEGYTQVRFVKKLVPVEENVEESKPESTENGNDKNDITSKKVKTEKQATKKQKTAENDDEEDTKPKPKKLSKAAQAKKGQVSITSFFKPAAKV